MSKPRAKKVALRALQLLVVLYLLAFLISVFTVLKMQTLTYNSTGWGMVLKSYSLDFSRDTAEVSSFDIYGTLSSHRETAFSTTEQIKIKAISAITLMPLWRREYNNPFVHDGDHWHTIIAYGQKEKATYGSNAYPIGYVFVYNGIISVFEK